MLENKKGSLEETSWGRVLSQVREVFGRPVRGLRAGKGEVPQPSRTETHCLIAKGSFSRNMTTRTDS